MTFNQIAEIFAARWSKEVNRTHIASIMRLREKSLIDPANSKKAKLFSSTNENDLLGLLPDRNTIHPLTSSPTMPMSGLDLLRLVDDDKTKYKNNKPITSISIIQNPSSSAVVPQESSFLPRTNKIQCEKCSSFFDSQSQLITHILTTPDHLTDSSFGAIQNNSYNSLPLLNTPDIIRPSYTGNIFDIKPEYNP